MLTSLIVVTTSQYLWASKHHTALLQLPYAYVNSISVKLGEKDLAFGRTLMKGIKEPFQSDFQRKCF